jgi:Fe-S cluster assembly ATP-binding protein
MSLLSIRNLSSRIYDSTTEEEKEILKGLDLDIEAGETHILMGTNGSGKSTLANVLMGHPLHRVSGGTILFDGADLLEMETDERARAGLFLAFQYPLAVPGLPVATFLKKATESYRGVEISVREFQKELRGLMKELEIPQAFLGRSLNEGFSGGEKKRLEILQLSLLKPRLAILDETDSGLDIDALKLLFQHIAGSSEGKRALLIITHYERVLDHIKPDRVHIMKDGRIVRSGGPELSRTIHAEGFESAVRG